MEPRDIFVGLGSNIEPWANVPKMLASMLQLAPAVDISPIVVTAAVDITGGGRDFLNLAARIRTPLPVAQVKDFFNSVEVGLGRDRTDPGRKHRDRTADLDILFTLPPGARAVPASIALPTEVYLRPQLDALLAYLGLAGAGSGPSADPQQQLRRTTIDFQGGPVGLSCTTLRANQQLPDEEPS
jgi:2-amino-4-hydroxy-6-hydroxymethyldihydropteridine diphosphokinase